MPPNVVRTSTHLALGHPRAQYDVGAEAGKGGPRAGAIDGWDENEMKTHGCRLDPVTPLKKKTFGGS